MRALDELLAGVSPSTLDPARKDVPWTNDANALAKVLSWLGFFPHRYSGRNMYGAECPAIDASAIALAHAILKHGPDEAQRALLMRALESAREDSLGRDFVLYFPRFTYQDAE